MMNMHHICSLGNIIIKTKHMAIFNVTNKDFASINKGKQSLSLLKKEKFDEFNESILGLGDLKLKPKKIDALSVIFDLEGFTNFCNQRDPELNVSLFLNEFLFWIFNELKTSYTEKKFEEGYLLYTYFPFLSKYLGDGILFLWDTENMNDDKICNIIVLIDNICKEYQTKFLPIISRKMVTPPTKLRCGIAKGTVFSVGNGQDYVGSCINVSARLQKIHNLSFCFSTIGIDYSKGMLEKTKLTYLQKKVNIRGIGDEIVCVRKIEFDKLQPEDKIHFKNV